MNSLDWFTWLGHCLLLSLLAVGGAMTTAPDMHRHLVQEHAWLSETDFSASMALAQAAPGPNVLFVAMLGWNVGWQAGTAAGWGTWSCLWASLAAITTLTATVLPSSVLTYHLSRWLHPHRKRLPLQAFKQGTAPIVVGLLLSTGWLMLTAQASPDLMVRHGLLCLLVVGLAWRTRAHPLWLLGAGAAAGALGWV